MELCARRLHTESGMVWDAVRDTSGPGIDLDNDPRHAGDTGRNNGARHGTRHRPRHGKGTTPMAPGMELGIGSGMGQDTGGLKAFQKQMQLSPGFETQKHIHASGPSLREDTWMMSPLRATGALCLWLSLDYAVKSPAPLSTVFCTRQPVGISVQTFRRRSVRSLCCMRLWLRI